MNAFRALSFLLLGVMASAGAGEPARETTVMIDGRPVLPGHGSVTGLWVFAEDTGAQLAMMGHPPRQAVAELEEGRRITIRVPIDPSLQGKPLVDTNLLEGAPPEVALRLEPRKGATMLTIDVSASNGPAAVQLHAPRIAAGGQVAPFAFDPSRRAYPERGPVACSPPLRPAIEQAVIEWDWRMQDGIATPREPGSFAEAIETLLERGDRLMDDLSRAAPDLRGQREAWKSLAEDYRRLKNSAHTDEGQWETLWRNVHRLRRAIVLSNPLANTGPLVFVKGVPSVMSHQLTQYYGYTAQPGGGVFVLVEPGRSMKVRELTGDLPDGCYLHPEVSYDGKTVYFAFCKCEAPPASWGDPDAAGRHYHLHSVRADGTGLRCLTGGAYDDFSPTCLPDGKLLFISTRRGGYHRCGRGPCHVYTLARAEADGSNPQPVSFHETNEWDPAVLNDGRVIYTRWDYVDRNAIFYQQLWTARQDGSDVRIQYGNNTLNPAGTWEAQPVPGSNKIMATAAPHHGMTAGSIILVDTHFGVDGPAPVTRLTPDALFPESESRLAHGIPVEKPTQFDDRIDKGWGPQPWSRSTLSPRIPEQERRWPGHCYRSPWPLSENYFLAAYSFDPLRGEPGTNRPNMFGLYLCDAFGNKELLYRDPNISSQWPVPLRSRTRPPVLRMASRWEQTTPGQAEGTFFMRNVRASWPQLPDVAIRQLRIVQVLPKTTPHANQPRVGAANASPGKQVLGTVPVEVDGSAYFRVPANTPVLFQALDARGRAVQTMRSLTYLQPGEQASCVGCHEPRTSTAIEPSGALALARPPSAIQPGPGGSRPLSYPVLVQPVLDRLCADCHNPGKPEGNVVLTGEPAGQFSRSYNALIPWVAYSAWGNPQYNYEPLTAPDRFGARASKLTKLLDNGHYDVKLSDDEWMRLVTWMDANALFYGTFNPEEQAKQLRGERIAGPDLQ